MLFNSIDFALFLPIVFILYWFVANKNLKIQNVLIVVASYVFYGWWDWRFLSLIIISSAVDFFLGLKIAKSKEKRTRKIFLIISLVINLGFLGIFKYYNFFLTNFLEAFCFFGHPINAQGLKIILPVGISFYTFQTLSYSIDIYKRKFKPTKDIIVFFAFVSFFPQLVAGPIERAINLLPQFCTKRTFIYEKAVDGTRQILWGLFKKVVIADQCARYVNDIFANFDKYSGSTLLVGSIFFALQIYGDFSGYSDIAIGTSRLFGFNLMKNFAFPYFSRDIGEFWRRWHISLSTWFRDYVYIPIGGSHGHTWEKIRNVFVVFVLSGFWHGANWTFIVWGALNAIYFLPLLLLNKNRKNINTVALGRFLPNIKEVINITVTFNMVVLAWIFFRAENLRHALSMISGIFSLSLFTTPEIMPRVTLLMIFLFLAIEWLGREREHAIASIFSGWKKYLRWAMYLSITGVILAFSGNEQQFIYFQF